jgi:hypothetical protein
MCLAEYSVRISFFSKNMKKHFQQTSLEEEIASRYVLFQNCKFALL